MNILAKLKGGVRSTISYARAHPVAALVLLVVVGSFVIIPAIALANTLKNKVPGLKSLPDLKARGSMKSISGAHVGE